jgi:LysR family transcriptional regulator, regulator of abg operon
VRLTQIRDFIAVVETGSIRAAARKLGVSQPTVTKSVRSLERELHLQLLQRSARGVVLTPPGRAFFPRARAAHIELRKAEEEALEQGRSGGGSLSLGAGPATLITLVPEAVARFRREYPAARVRIVEGLAHQLLPALRDETLDLVLGLRPAGELDAQFTFRPLFRSELAVAARRGHPLRHARTVAELASADWLSTATLGLAGGPLERIFAAAGREPPRPMIRCDSYNTLVTLMAKTDMVGVLQRRLLKEPFARECLQEIPVRETLPAVTAGVFTRRDTPLTRAAAAMSKAVVAVARSIKQE